MDTERRRRYPVRRYSVGRALGRRALGPRNLGTRYLGRRYLVALVCVILQAPTYVAAAATVPADGASLTRFTPPVPLRVVGEFVPPPTRYAAGHRGVDLAARPGAPVRAAADGIVVFAGVLVDRGVVSIEHSGGLRTTYEPVDSVVAAGDAVAAGQTIGHVSGRHEPCAPQNCLHVGARMPDRIYLDPMSLFGPWRVRLKPWEGAAVTPTS